MMAALHYRIVDLAVFLIANLVNLLLIGFFLARARGAGRIARLLGMIIVALALPVAAASALNALWGREWWMVVLPLLFVLYCSVELLLDYILKREFRHTRLLGPYLTVYYLGLLGLMGYCFGVNTVYGFVTLVTYFANLLATWYSFARVGHGLVRPEASPRAPSSSR
jgi:hypothetical protein